MKKLAAILAVAAAFSSGGVRASAEPVEPANAADRSLAENAYRDWLGGEGLTFDDGTVACAISQTGPADFAGICYANNEDPGVLAHLVTRSGLAAPWVFELIAEVDQTEPDASAEQPPSNADGRPIAYELDSAPTCELTGGVGVGMSGSDVECLETRLEQVTVGPINFEVDGTFDEDTEQAVIWFQEEHCLLTDGIVGPQTAILLGIWPGSNPADDETATASEPCAPAATGGSSTPAESAITIADGVWIVGEDVQPGLYRTTVPADSYNCYWARLNNFSGDRNIIANDNHSAGEQAIVEILEGDVGFESSGCGTWELVG